jgi:hypothetical protein
MLQPRVYADRAHLPISRMGNTPECPKSIAFSDAMPSVKLYDALPVPVPARWECAMEYGHKRLGALPVILAVGIGIAPGVLSVISRLIILT